MDVYSDAVSVDVALERVRHAVNKLHCHMVSLGQASGLVLAEAIYSPIDLPIFPNSAMDGFACRSQDIQFAAIDHPIALTIVGRIAAGHAENVEIVAGTATKIMTGAPIPTGTDTVLKYEDVTWNDQQLFIATPSSAGNNIRQAGEDLVKGQLVLAEGTELSAASMGLLAAVGIGQVSCIRRPRIAVFGTGDELVAPGNPLAPSQIYDANDPMLAELLRMIGSEVLEYGSLPDNRESIHAALSDMQRQHVDAIISSGGVSAGDFDIVKDILQNEGHIEFWKIRMRPGKPLAFGLLHGIPYLGLPGNPLAAFTGCLVFGQTIVAALSGRANAIPNILAMCAEPIRNGSQKRNFLRGYAELQDGKLYVRQSGRQGPNHFSALAVSNCLIIAHEDRTLYEKGELIPIIRIPGTKIA